jgi:hypothetical protein
VTATLNPGQGGCTEGGVSVEIEGSGTKKSVCNGEEGSPWTAGGTLPAGATETGTWAIGKISNTSNYPGPGTAVHTPISFSIQLASALDGNHVHYLEPNGKEKVLVVIETPFSEELKELVQPACPGTASQPEALPGNLCVYTGEAENVQTNRVTFNGTLVSNPIVSPANESNFGSGTTGAIVNVFSSGTSLSATGTWAVTSE